MEVRTRIAPSPTGEDIHIGNLYTALMNWAFAHKNQGKFIIRIEDTDRERFIEGSEERILQSLKDFGLNYDEGPDNGGPFAPYRQSERLPIYQKYAKELIEKDLAYYCFCSKEKLAEVKQKQEETRVYLKHLEYCDRENAEGRIGKGEKFVIRMKIPENLDITFNDLIRGDITINTAQLDDQVILKSDGFPTYHLGVVVDDNIMEISHVIRAEEWISSTPKHILLYRAFDWQLPVFAHMPILRNPDKSKLSKRKNPVWVSWYLKEGFLPEAILNYLALMGWSHPEQKEIFSLEEFIEKLQLEDIKPVGPAFDLTKLEWMNGEYIRQMSDEELTKRLEDFLVDHPAKDKIGPVVPLIKERIKKLSDFIPLTYFLFEKPEYDLEVFEKIKVEEKVNVLSQVSEEMSKLEKPWEAKVFEENMRALGEKLNLKPGDFFQLIRVAFSGQTVTPPLFESMKIVGEEETLQRIRDAADFLKR